MHSPGATESTQGEYICPFFDLTPEKGGAVDTFKQLFISSNAQQVTMIELLRQIVDGQKKIINGLESADYSIFVKNTLLSPLYVIDPPVPPVETDSLSDFILGNMEMTPPVNIVQVAPAGTSAGPRRWW